MDVPFFGAPTTDPLALDAVLAEAAGVRILPRGFWVHDGDPEQEGPYPAGRRTVWLADEVLTEIHDAAAAQDLRRVLEVSHLDNFECMCVGKYTLEFLDAAGGYLSAVGVDHPSDRITWTRWEGGALVRDSQALQDWLGAHVPPDATPVPRYRRKKPRWTEEQHRSR